MVGTRSLHHPPDRPGRRASTDGHQAPGTVPEAQRTATERDHRAGTRDPGAHLGLRVDPPLPADPAGEPAGRLHRLVPPAALRARAHHARGRASNLARLDVGRYDAPRYDPRSNVSHLAAAPPAAARAPSQAACAAPRSAVAAVTSSSPCSAPSASRSSSPSPSVARCGCSTSWSTSPSSAYVGDAREHPAADRRARLKVRHLPPTAGSVRQAAPPQLAPLRQLTRRLPPFSAEGPPRVA